MGASLAAQTGKNPPAMQEARRPWFNPWIREIPQRRARQPTSVFLSEEFHSMDRGAWRAMLHRIAKSRTRLKLLSTQAINKYIESH